MNMCEVWSTITVKSVMAGEYTAPPAQGPMMIESCGMTPRRVHVALEDLGVEAECDDALLDPRAARVVQPDDRAAGLEARSRILTIFSPNTSPERAAEDREVLREHADLATVDRPEPVTDPVAVRPVLLQPEGGGAVPGELVDLDEGPLSSSASIRSRAVFLPFACCFSTARADPACTASSLRRCRSASRPAVVFGRSVGRSVLMCSRVSSERLPSRVRRSLASVWGDLERPPLRP
jgi:hypothetical protein